MKPYLVIEIDGDGTVSIDAIGYQGKACEAATREIEALLGGPRAVKSKKLKPEYQMAGGPVVKAGAR